MRNIYVDADENNHLRKVSFYEKNEGYVAFDRWIGFTEDSGRSYTRKYITNSNVNYNGNYVNLTFGFTVNGVHAFNKDTLVVFGHYGFVPAILFSSNQGNSFLLTYHSIFNPDHFYDGVRDVLFPEENGIGFAIIDDKVIRTFNKGMSWSIVYAQSGMNFKALDFLDVNTGYVLGNSNLIKTTNTGTSWQAVNSPPGIALSFEFIDEQRGWINSKNPLGNIYSTNDGGITWALKNDSEFYNIYTSILRFVNDSTGFALNSYDILKTTDAGHIWEEVERDNNYSFLNYSHNHLQIFGDSIIWAGGGHGFLEISNNLGGNTIPDALFGVDLTQFASNNTIAFINHSKPGYDYTWVKNSSVFSTSFHSSYVTNHLSIDTILLIVNKGNYSDTSEKIIDTRLNPHPCFASFQTVIDTGTVKFFPGDTAIGLKHYWYIGDGTVDSFQLRPIHVYDSVGTYTVKHIVHNTLDNCIDSTVKSIYIVRTQNCLIPTFTYIADTFYTNKLSFFSDYDHDTETGSSPMVHVGWNWGDGATTEPHIYQNPGFYNVCLTVKNRYTGCISSTCKPVFVYMDTVCNADILVKSSGRVTKFDAKPLAVKTGKRHSWIVNGWDMISTGNAETMERTFFETNYGGGTGFNLSGNNCGPNTFEICIDSLDKRITHIVYDSVTGCTDSQDKIFRVERDVEVFIKAIPYPGFSQYATFYAYTLNSAGDTIPYYTRWRIGNSGSYYYAGAFPGNASASSSISYTFRYPGTFKVAVGANACAGGRELYYINYTVVLDSCPIMTPNFVIGLWSGHSNRIRFDDYNYGVNSGAGNWGIIDYGDGTSASYNSPSVHAYLRGGIYTVKLKYTNPNGCVNEIMKSFTVNMTCGSKIAFEPGIGGFLWQWQVNMGTGFQNISNGGVYSGATASVLTMQSPPIAFSGYKYRCLITTGSGVVEGPVRIFGFTNTWTGAISGNWNDSNNWSCGFVPDVHTDVIIVPGTLFPPELNASITIRSLSVAAGAVLLTGQGVNINLTGKTTE